MSWIEIRSVPAMFVSNQNIHKVASLFGEILYVFNSSSQLGNIGSLFAFVSSKRVKHIHELVTARQDDVGGSTFQVWVNEVGYSSNVSEFVDNCFSTNLLAEANKVIRFGSFRRVLISVNSSPSSNVSAIRSEFAGGSQRVDNGLDVEKEMVEAVVRALGVFDASVADDVLNREQLVQDKGTVKNSLGDISVLDNGNSSCANMGTSSYSLDLVGSKLDGLSTSHVSKKRRFEDVSKPVEGDEFNCELLDNLAKVATGNSEGRKFCICANKLCKGHCRGWHVHSSKFRVNGVKKLDSKSMAKGKGKVKDKRVKGGGLCLRDSSVDEDSEGEKDIHSFVSVGFFDEFRNGGFNSDGIGIESTFKFKTNAEDGT
ncbi:uncharacterized protein [Rutidosis leptorrhynchoides]|uniref:uncharacterized protein n=1 Tax=Rutidosis leptorrhynchoides TaxID=125765 RepID=UPI003A9A595F